MQATLTATTADVVQIQQFWDGINIKNLDATNALFVTWDGTVPTAGLEGTSMVPPNGDVTFRDGFITNYAGIPGSSTAATVCHRVGIVGNGGSYGVEGVSGL